ncbi:BCCT family transporter [Bacillus tianshenii]|nr:BCCT family transporter [Bacillus tianshenii]
MDNKPEYHNPVFWVSVIVTTAFVIWGALSPDSLSNQATKLFNFTTINFGWLYLVSVLFFVLFLLYLAFSKYGKIRLGHDDERPEYSFFTWIGMLFSAGFGVGLVFWGVAEPMEHFMNPPLKEMDPQTPESARLAMRYSFFHWGVHQWSVFTVVGLALAYLQFRKNQKSLISESFRVFSKTNSKPKFSKTIDTLAVIATVTGVATSLGLGIMQINGGMHYVFDTPNSAVSQIVITVILTVLYTISSTSGLDKGIKILSNVNLALALGLMLLFLFLGPTVFILNSLVVGIGDYIQHFFEMSLRLTPYQGGGKWIRDWTIFYWAWVIAWSPFVGSFVARVSRGRTVREFIIGTMIIPPALAAVWMAIFGGTALHMDLFKGTKIAEAVQNDVTTALFETFSYFPFDTVLSVLAITLIFTFLITSADSATFVLGMMTSKGTLHPNMPVKMIWGVLQASIAIVLIISSGLQGLQTASLVTALPFTIILIFMCFSIYKYFKQEPHIPKRQRVKKHKKKAETEAVE